MLMCLPRVELSCRRVAVQAPDVVGVPSAAGQRGRVVRSQPPGPPRRRAAAAVTACARGPTPCRRHLRARAHQPPPQLPVLNPVLRGVKQGGCERQASAGRRPLEGEAPWARWRQETPSPDV